MSFLAKKIQLKGFRSYRNVSVDLDPFLTIFYGPNAVGKTNLIEALQLTTEGISFRNPNWEDVVNWDRAQKIGVSKIASGPDCEFLTSVKLFAEGDDRKREVEMIISNNRRSFFVNGKKVRSFRDIAGVLPCVVFTPNDLTLVKSSSERRRAEVDDLGSQLSKKYNQLKNGYKKVLQQRNKLLKEDVSIGEVFDVISDQLVDYGVSLSIQRLKLVQRITPHIIDIYKNIDPTSELTIGYRINFQSHENMMSEEVSIFLDTPRKDLAKVLKNSLKNESGNERARKTTTVGPHRDDIVFFINGRDARTFGSQGQQRSITLAWKIAEAKIIEDITQQKPILLLDDVMSELDEDRRDALTGFVGEVAQTVITTANIDYFKKSLLDKARIINVAELEGEHRG
ncbi:MAG: DNA replication/repair protein RecF [Coriobacteriia bacterium]|nr:DNA replication/repair protein RecF [Coriobacteriia bacterium]